MVWILQTVIMKHLIWNFEYTNQWHIPFDHGPMRLVVSFHEPEKKCYISSTDIFANFMFFRNCSVATALVGARQSSNCSLVNDHSFSASAAASSSEQMHAYPMFIRRFEQRYGGRRTARWYRFYHCTQMSIPLAIARIVAQTTASLHLNGVWSRSPHLKMCNWLFFIYELNALWYLTCRANQKPV